MDIKLPTSFFGRITRPRIVGFSLSKDRTVQIAGESVYAVPGTADFTEFVGG